MREGEDGVFPIERSLHIDATKEYILDDGECILDADQMIDLGSDAEGEEGEGGQGHDKDWPVIPSTGILSLEETTDRFVAVATGEGEVDNGVVDARVVVRKSRQECTQNLVN